jgi:hypothetical protein
MSIDHPAPGSHEQQRDRSTEEQDMDLQMYTVVNYFKNLFMATYVHI